MVDPVCHQSNGGSLLYAAIATRPDIAQVVGIVSKYSSCHTEAHLTAVKNIFRYLKGTIDLGLKNEELAINNLVGFSDSDWPGDRHNRHSITGNLFAMSGGAISFSARTKQLSHCQLQKQSMLQSVMQHKRLYGRGDCCQKIVQHQQHQS